MEDFATINDMTDLWREMTPQETIRAIALLPVVSDNLRVEADKVGKDLDEMVLESKTYANVVKSVVADSGIDATVSKEEDILEIVKYRVPYRLDSFH